MAEAKRDPPKPAQAAGPAPSADPLIGARLGEYVVEKPIGSGGMGLVYRGLQPLIGKAVAIKVLQWETARNPEEVQRLLGEAQLVNAVRHRGIVDIFAFGTTPDGRNYLVMELLEGDPLDALIARRAPLPISEVLDVLDEVLDALGAAHAAGVIHRDLKPQNVFVVSPAHGKRYVKLLDFGLAKKSLTPGGSAAQTRASMIVGTPYYMSPEQARGEPISPQTDLYALGVLAYEMLTSRLPFEAPTPYEVITQHLNTPAPRVRDLESSIPEELDDMIAKMLEKVPADRPQSASDLRRELERLRKKMQSDSTQIGEPLSRPRALIEEPVPARPPPPPPPSMRAGRPAQLRPAWPPPPPPTRGDNDSLELADGPSTLPFPTVEEPQAERVHAAPPVDEPPLELDGPSTPQAVEEPVAKPVSKPPLRGSVSMRRSRADLPRDLKVPVARRKRNWKPLWGSLIALLVLALGAYAALLLRPELAAHVPFDVAPLQLERVRAMLPAMPKLPKIQIVPAGEDPEPAAPKEPQAQPPAKDAVQADPAAKPEPAAAKPAPAKPAPAKAAAAAGKAK